MKSFKKFMQSGVQESMKGFVTNIEQHTMDNNYFRKVIHTAPHLQLVLMSLYPGQDIGAEIHDDLDQFIRIESGNGLVILDDRQITIEEDSAIIIPRGMHHNLINTSSSEYLKLYAIYSRPEHDAFAQEQKFT